MTTMLSCPPTPILAPISGFNQEMLASFDASLLNVFSDGKPIENQTKPCSLTS